MGIKKFEGVPITSKKLIGHSGLKRQTVLNAGQGAYKYLFPTHRE